MSANFLEGWGANIPQIEQAFRDGLMERIERQCPAVERRRGLSLDEFRTQYREQNKPVVLEGALSSWPAASKWTFDYLAAECGSVPVVIDHYSPERTVRTTFADFAERVRQNTGPGATPLYLQEWHFLTSCPALARELGPLEIASYDFFPRLYGPDYAVRALWIGQQGAVTRLHQDTFFNDVVHGQIRGRKQWCLFAPDTVVPVTEDNKPNFDALFEAPAGNVLHCTLTPGDVIYLPMRWWHRVNLVEDSIAIGMQTLDERNLFVHMKARLQELLPIILNQEHIKKTYPDLYQITLTRLAVQAKRFGIDLTRTR